jgi:energy-coupling factor transporter transmembrane protein EcfT
MILTIKLLFLIAGMYLMIMGHWVLALICFAITIGLTFILSLGLFFVGLIAVLMLTGCGSFVKTENIYIDNSAVNNFVGNSCGFYLGDRCLVWKDGRMARNPENPYKGNK